MEYPDNNHPVYRDARLLYDFLSGHEPKDAHADILLIPGSHDLRVADHAARLFLSGRADFLVCSGGFGKITEGTFDQPEGWLFAARCRDLGVPPERIIVEDRAANTGQNFTFSRAVLAGRGIHPASGLIVCKPYMARRALATAEKQWPRVLWMVDPAPIPFEQYAGPDTPFDQLVELMVGDLQRLWVYADRGFQVPVPVPEAVLMAYARLVQAGYDRFVIPEAPPHE